ncbi:MAG: proteasome assembly chaperone family protein [Candidatus Bathyarchaeota archaeon]|nr:proteasome assembly chaperone family protein [Candidatus Bathyarchaeota archaeon]
MKETTIIEKKKVELKNPILIEGLPGLGLVGKIAAEYLAKQLKAKKLAELYSPHFAYYVLVDKKGNVRLLRSEFYYWKNESGENDLILLTGDSQAQTVEGQYEVAGAILDFADEKNVKIIVTIGGYRKEVKDEPQVFASATNPELLKKALEAGSKNSPSGGPIVGTAGLLIGLAKLKEAEAACFLVETPGYLPDPRAAKSVLNVIMKMLGFEVDLSGLDKEISKSKRIEKRMQMIEEQRRISERRRRKIEEEKVSYIS